MNNTLGEYIKNYRIKHDLSLREFAKLADLSHTHVDSIEKGQDFRTGKQVRVTNETILKLAKALQVDERYLFEISIGRKPIDIPTPELSNRSNIPDIQSFDDLSPENIAKVQEYIDMLRISEKSKKNIISEPDNLEILEKKA